MLGSSDFPIETALEFFTTRGIEAGFLVPTETGLQKSIMDAHGALRSFLFDVGVHDYAAQVKGPDNKVIVDAVVLGAFEAKRTQVSLYRPQTKDGDPRIWIYGLSAWAQPGNLLALFVVDHVLYLANLSDLSVWEARDDPDSPLGDVLRNFTSEEDLIARELVEKLTEIARAGWLKSGRVGDTGVGFTLETALGIAANSRRAPDYKGIELKSGRGGRANRTSLFSQVPDWRSSAVPSARGLLDQFGYVGEEERRQLYCTNHARPNPLGLFMAVDDLDVHLLARQDLSVRRVVQWSLPSLEASLAKKHNSTFWVKADVHRDHTGAEFFHYRSVRHTRAAITANLGPLIDTGKVTLDLTLSELDSGRVRDHGYLFRMAPTHQGLLFPPPTEYELAPPMAPPA